jgi:hypothetical protein
MSDTWERRAIPYVDGWNKAPNDGPQFTVVFDQNADTLTITADQPVFGALDEFTGEGENPDGSPGWTFSVPNGNFTIDSATQITLAGAWNYLVASPGVNATITQLDFFNAGPTLIGTWTGTAAITEPVSGDPLIENYSYIDFYDTATSPPSFMSPGCGTVATANAAPSIFFYSQNMLSGGADGVRLVVDGSPVDYIASVDPQFFGDGVIADDGYFLLSDPALAGTQVTSAQPIDSGGNPVGVATPLQLNYNTVLDAGIQSGDPDVLEIAWDVCHEQPTQINVTRCTPNNGQQYYDPLGPQAGFNPVGATFVQWDTTAIIIDHPAFIGVGPIHRIDTRDAEGRTFAITGDTLPSI